MDGSHHAVLDWLRERVSAPVLVLPRGPEIRRRLYGALLGAGAAALGVSSSDSLRNEGVAAWQAQHAPRPSTWRTAAEARGLRPILRDAELQRWMRLMPRDSTPRSAWWDPENQALWVLPDGSEESGVQLFTTRSKPDSRSSAPRLLGTGWVALEALESAEIVRSKPTKRPPRKSPSRDPREWNF
jgi:hypothetical protein